MFTLTAVLALLSTAGYAHAATIHSGSISTLNTAADLDTTGNFAYALSLGDEGSEGFDAGTGSDGVRVIGGLDFAGASQTNEPAGVNINEAGNSPFQKVNEANFGDTDLNTLVGTTVYNQPLTIDLDVVQGQLYKLQLVTWEPFFTSTGNRLTDITIDGSLVVEDLDPATAGGKRGDNPGQAVIYTYTFTAPDNVLNISATATQAGGGGSNANFSAATLEIIPEPASLALVGLGSLMLLARRRG